MFVSALELFLFIFAKGPFEKVETTFQIKVNYALHTVYCSFSY